MGKRNEMSMLWKNNKENASNAEKEWSWHKKCVKSFFMTEEMPF